METNGSNITNLTECEKYSGDPMIIRATVFSFIALTNFFGLVGNSLSVYIFTRPSLRSSINTLIAGLAVADIAFEITGLVMNFPFGLYYFHGNLCPYWSAQTYVSIWVYPVGSIALTLSIWTHVLITFERYIAVCHPLKAKNVCTVNFSLSGYGSVFLFAILFNLCRFWELRLVRSSGHARVDMWLKGDPLYQQVYTIWLYLLVMVLLPLLVLSTFNTKIILALRAAAQKRRGMTSFYVKSSTKDRKSRRPTEVSVGESPSGLTEESVSVRLLSEKKPTPYTDPPQQTDLSSLPPMNSKTMISKPAEASNTDKGSSQYSSTDLNQNSRTDRNNLSCNWTSDDAALKNHSSNHLDLTHSRKSLNSITQDPISSQKLSSVLSTINRQLSRRKIRRSSEKEGGRESRTTQMMLVIIFIFLSCNSLSFILAIVEVARGSPNPDPDDPLEAVLAAMTDVSNLLISVSPALNSVVYYRYSANYRTQLLQLLKLKNR